MIWAALSIIGSNASQGAKLVWILAVLVFPVLGLIVWFLAGPRKA